MIKVRKSEERGFANHGWLQSRHTFSFANYYDPSFMGYSILRVINEDKIQGGTGFGTHAHRNMEIISYVVEGALQHKDSMGTKAVILPGEIQRMSAGTGIQHSEYNNHKDQKAHFLQIWIEPQNAELEPSYAQQSFKSQLDDDEFVLVASPSGQNDSVTIQQDIFIYACKTKLGSKKHYSCSKGRHIWIQLIKGNIEVDGQNLSEGDGAAIEGVEHLKLTWDKGAEFLLFDMP